MVFIDSFLVDDRHGPTILDESTFRVVLPEFDVHDVVALLNVEKLTSTLVDQHVAASEVCHSRAMWRHESMPFTHLLIHCPGLSQLNIGDLGEGDMTLAVELGACEQTIVGDFVNSIRANARIATIARP